VTATYFISDLHISENNNINKLFIKFLDILKPNDTLYILGDFFDYWITSPADKLSDFQQNIFNLLKKTSEKNIEIIFMPGNRDFLINKKFLSKFKIKFLPNQETKLNIHNKNILIAHGDQFCTDDISYQRYKKIVEKQWLQKLFFSLPEFTRKYIGNKIRNQSKKYQKKLEKPIDVSLKTIENVAKNSQANYIIHGHTHRKATHYHNNKKTIRLVLGDWHESGSYIKITEKSNPRLYDFK
jgi:UDP-2,3-diacylglucosamine hydrolase